MSNVIDESAPFQKVQRFGETFVVRRGTNNIKEIWQGITGLNPNAENFNCPDFLITNATSDGDDGLCWTSWEECLVEYAAHAWGLNTNLMTEATLYIGRQDQEKNDVVDLIAAIVAKWGDFSATRLLSQLAYNLGKRILKPEILDRVWRIQTGLGRMLRITHETENVDPVAATVSGVEDGNHHDLAEALRTIRDT